MVDRRKLDLSGITPQPPAATPGDLGSGETPDEDLQKVLEEEKKWRDKAKRGPLWVALQRTALLVGLAVVLVIVSRLVYRRFQR
jgi:hypothetical protein